MTVVRIITLGGMLLFMASCASEKVNYDLPSAASKEQPQWVGTQSVARDSIYIVVSIPRQTDVEMTAQIQEAQSALHTILVNELDTIIRDYWVQKGTELSEIDEFNRVARLPHTLESVMKHVAVKDGWENVSDRSYLCALDYEDVSQEIMTDMKISDKAFADYLKRRMDELSRKYK